MNRGKKNQIQQKLRHMGKNVTSSCSQKSTLRTLGLLWGHFTRWSASLVATASSVVAYCRENRHSSCACVCVCVCAHGVHGTHGDKAVRLDLVNPKALLHNGAGSAEQLFELAQSKWADLWETAKRCRHTGPPRQEQAHKRQLGQLQLRRGRPTRLVTWMMLESLPRHGEGCLVVRMGSSMVMDTPDFCWLMERRTTLSLGVTAGIQRAHEWNECI